MHAHHGTDLLALSGDPGVAQLAGAATLADPFGGGPPRAIPGGNTDVAAKLHDGSEPQGRQECAQLLVAKAAVGQDRDPATNRGHVGQRSQAGVLEVVAPGCDLLFAGPQPQQWGHPAVAGRQAQHQRGLAVMVEVGPVHRDQDIRPSFQLLQHPEYKAVPDADALVAHQPLQLLDRMLGNTAPGLRQRLADSWTPQAMRLP